MSGHPGAPGIGALRTLYRWLLALYPDAWSEADRRELVAFFEARYRDAWERGGARAAAAAVWSAFGDAVTSGLGERLASGRPHENPHGREEGGMGDGIGGIVRDARTALRGLMRTPGFTVVCVLTLALGIGPNTALFTVLRGLVLAPLPYPDADRIVSIRRDLVVRGIPNYPAAPADLLDYREHTDAFEAIAGFHGMSPIMTEGDLTERLTGVATTPELFDVLGVRPALGRAFTREEGLDGGGSGDDDAPPTFPLILSHGFWERRFGADPDVLGRSLSFGGASGTVVGVMPEGFRLILSPDDGVQPEPDVMMPFTLDPANPFRGSFFLRTVARLAPGATLDVAAAQMKAASAWQREQYPNAKAAGTDSRLVPLAEDVSAGVRPLLLGLGGALTFVLLIACVNVANLLLVRSAGRGRELSVRRALGGGRGRLARQLLVESGVIALAGGTLGVVLAWLTLPVLSRAVPPDLPRLQALELSPAALGFTLGAVVLAAFLFGTLPALRGSRADVMDALRGRSGTSAGAARVRSGLVVVEVALSFVLVVGAGLMARSVLALHRVDPGFEPEGALTFELALPPGGYQGLEAHLAVRERLREELLALPGVSAAAASTGFPLGGSAGAAPYGGETELADGDESDLRQANVRVVGDGYFETLGTPLLAGRELVRTDATDSVVKVLVDQPLAERTWPGESAVGKRIYVKVAVPGIWFEVAGVVGHQRHDDLSGPSLETIYFPPGSYGGLPFRWTVRSAGDPVDLVPAVRAAVARVDDRILVENVEPLAERVDRAIAPTLIVARFVAAFGLLALVLALIGLYGVIAYQVKERKGELGLRMALGADRGTILKSVLGAGVRLTALGVGLGIAGAFTVRKVAASLLTGVAAPDAATLTAIALLFVAMAGAASLVPARRAVGVDPMVALREE